MLTIETVVEEGEEEGPQEEAVEEEVVEVNPQLSLCALVGNIQDTRCHTMRVLGQVKKGEMNILIDSGSTHNFLDSYTAKKMGCVAKAITPVFVAVANGDKLVCRNICKGFRWRMQGYEFEADMLLLSLGGCDMVLEVEWLATLGDITWNFLDLTMRFNCQGKSYNLLGAREPKKKEVEAAAFEKVLHKMSCNRNLPQGHVLSVRFVTEDTRSLCHMQVEKGELVEPRVLELLD